jgi:transposase
VPNNRLSMRQIKEVMRLHFECGRSKREVARAMNLSATAVWEYLQRAKRAELTFERAQVLDDATLETLLFPPVPPSRCPRPMPNWPQVHRELSKKNVTLDLLWSEYKAQEPEGYGYSWFCKHYERWAAALPVTLRQVHVPGEKLFIDYSGNKLGIVDPNTGEIREAELFVATLGASNYTYAEVTWTQQLPDWIGSHVRALTFFGGCVEILVPDNLKSGVHKASFYDPVVNRTYGEMATHYSVAIIPARSGRPRDKAKVEQAVLLAQRWILARLRNYRLFSLEEANRAIAALLVTLNNKPFKKLPGCRRSAFEELDRPALRPLPERPYQYAQWKVARVGILCGQATSVASALISCFQRRSSQSEGHRSRSQFEEQYCLSAFLRKEDFSCSINFSRTGLQLPATPPRRSTASGFDTSSACNAIRLPARP